MQAATAGAIPSTAAGPICKPAAIRPWGSFAVCGAVYGRPIAPAFNQRMKNKGSEYFEQNKKGISGHVKLYGIGGCACPGGLRR